MLISKLTIWREPLALFALCVLVAVCYGQTLAHSFFWDSNHIFKHDAMRELSWASLGWILTNTVNANWHPVSLLSHIIDFSVFGWHAGGHHLVNVVLHCLVTFSVFYLIKALLQTRMDLSKQQTEVFFVAALTSLIFALHPLRVESVAWVAARKDLLYSLFYLLSISSYLLYRRTEQNAWRYYVLSVFLFAVALLSKSMAVTLPAVLLLLDYFPLNRFSRQTWRRQLLIAVVDKVPYVLMSLGVIVVTLLTQADSIADERLTQIDQAANAMHNVLFYLTKFFIPTGLVPFYPFPGDDVFYSISYWLPALCVIVLATVISGYLAFRGQPVWFVCWSIYLVTLAPASGVIHVGSAVAADRYTYLTLLPVTLLVAIACLHFWQRFVALRRVSVITLCLVTVMLTGITAVQVRHWRSPIELWSHVLRNYPDAALAHKNLSVVYQFVGDYKNGIYHLQYLAYQGWPVGEDLVEAILTGGDPGEALAEYRIVLETQALNANQRMVLEEVVASLAAAQGD